MANRYMVGGCGCEKYSQRTMIRVGDDVIGIVMLEQVFAEAFNTGIKSEDSEAVFKKIAWYNHVPPKAKKEYKEAIAREYRKYCEKKEQQKGSDVIWHG